MTPSKPHYSPWEAAEAGDDQVTEPLDAATPGQLGGFVSELLSIAESRAEQPPATEATRD